MIKLSSISANKTVGLPVKSHVVKIFLLKKQLTDPQKASSVIRLRPKTSLQNFGKREFHLHENITVHTKRMTRRSKNLRNSKYTRHKAHTKHTTTLHTNHQIARCKNQTKGNLERKLDPPVLNPKMNEKKLDRSTKTKNLKRKPSMFWTQVPPRSSQRRETTTRTNRSYYQLTGVLSTAVENVIKIITLLKL
jgi:hypothetical protein